MNGLWCYVGIVGLFDVVCLEGWRERGGEVEGVL